MVYLTNAGLNVTQTYSNRLVIDASGSTAAVEKAFGVQISDFTYQNRSFYAPTSNIQIPAAFQPVIAGVVGLDNFLVMQNHVSLKLPSSHSLTATSGYLKAP